jgi:mitogen-activated protein kinase organizer 1
MHKLKQTQLLKGHTGAVQAITFNVEGNYCLSGGQDKIIRLWNPHKGLLIKTYPGHGYEVNDIAVAADNSRFASVGGDRSPFLWDVATGRTIRKFRGHESAVNCIIFNKVQDENTVIVTGSYDKTIRIWDLKSNSIDPVQILDEARDSVTSLFVTEYEIVAGSVDGKIRNYDIRAGILRTDVVNQPITSISLSHDGNCILVGCLNNSIRLLDKSTGEHLSTYTGHKNLTYKIDSCLSNDDAYVLSGSEDNNIHIWDLVNASSVLALKGHFGPVCGLAYHPTQNMLLSSSADSTVRLWA